MDFFQNDEALFYLIKFILKIPTILKVKSLFICVIELLLHGDF